MVDATCKGNDNATGLPTHPRHSRRALAVPGLRVDPALAWEDEVRPIHPRAQRDLAGHPLEPGLDLCAEGLERRTESAGVPEDTSEPEAAAGR